MLRAALASSFILLLASHARAEDARFSATNTLISEYRTNNQNGHADDDHYGVFVDRLNLSGGAAGVSGSMRVDGFAFAGPPTPAYEDSLRLERLTLQYQSDGWRLTGGDFFKQLGRGFVLSLRKIDEAGLDLALRGAEVFKESKGHQLSIFAGTVNAANLDSISQKFLDDPTDALVGGSYEFSGFSFAQMGLLGLVNLPEERILEDEQDLTLSGGIYAEAPEIGDWLSLYFEADLQDRKLGGKSKPGAALYATADLTLGSFSVLFEALYLDDWEQKGSKNSALGARFEYNQPPTLERIDQEVFNNRDTLGGRVRIERLIESLELLLYANGMLRLNDLGEPNELRQVHGYLGFEYSFDEGASVLNASGGLRDESLDIARVKSVIHAELNYLQALDDDGTALHLAATNEFRTLEQAAFVRGSSIVGIEMAGVGGLSVEVGYDTQDPSDDVRKLFIAGLFALEISEMFHVRAIGGTQRGGIKCVGGVCRDFPEFAGARAELVVRL